MGEYYNSQRQPILLQFFSSLAKQREQTSQSALAVYRNTDRCRSYFQRYHRQNLKYRGRTGSIRSTFERNEQTTALQEGHNTLTVIFSSQSFPFSLYLCLLFEFFQACIFTQNFKNHFYSFYFSNNLYLFSEQQNALISLR